MELNKLIDKRFPIEKGSGTLACTWSKDKLFDYLSEVIKHNLFDYTFYYQLASIDKHQEYLELYDKHIGIPMAESLEENFDKWFYFTTTPYSRKEEVLVCKLKENNEQWIDNWFQTNEAIPRQIRQAYFDYREDYAGVKLSPKSTNA